MAKINTIAGDIYYKTDGDSLTCISWSESDNTNPSNKLDGKVKANLEEYFKNKRQKFDVPINPQGTEFQQRVWKELLKIPYGKTVTYKDVADAIGSHPRAVGMAVGKNPIPIIIPCHRVIGKNGKMTGFSGGEGIKTKEILLNLEQNLQN